MSWDILKEIFWWKFVECSRRMEKILEYGGRERKEGKKGKERKREEGKNVIGGEIKNN